MNEAQNKGSSVRKEITETGIGKAAVISSKRSRIRKKTKQDLKHNDTNPKTHTLKGKKKGKGGIELNTPQL